MVSQAEIEYAMIAFTKTFNEYKDKHLILQNFSDGWIFTTILHTACNFKLSFNGLIEKPQKWTFKFNNLKKIIKAIQQYFESQIKKVIRTNDIDLVQISKNNNVSEIIKFFQLIVAVITQAPNKQDHIGTIMSLDERSQAIFVQIIQNLLQNRVSDSREDFALSVMTQLQLQNQQLQTQGQLLIKQNMELSKQIQILKLRNEDYEEEIERIRGKQYQKVTLNHEEPKQKEHLRNMIENLREKLYQNVKQNQQKVGLYKQEIHHLQGKLIKFDEIEQQLLSYKKKHTQTIESYGKAKTWQRERIKLCRILEQKDQKIRRLQQKIDETNQLNYSMQQKQVYMKMQLQRRDVRFKQLQKQVRRKFENSTPTSINDSSITTHNSNMGILSNELNEKDTEQLEQLRGESEKNRRRIRQVQRENNKMKRNMQKMFVIENDKKKLQRLVLDANRDKLDQMELLIQTLYDQFMQNKSMKALLQQNNIQF